MTNIFFFRLLKLQHGLVLSLPTLLLELISLRAMSGQVEFFSSFFFFSPFYLDILNRYQNLWRNILNLVPSSGKRSYNGRSLHHIGGGLNPYEQAISIIGKTLAAFDDDNLIPCYGFGDGQFMITLWLILKFVIGLPRNLCVGSSKLNLCSINS